MTPQKEGLLLTRSPFSPFDPGNPGKPCEPWGGKRERGGQKGGEGCHWGTSPPSSSLGCFDPQRGAPDFPSTPWSLLPPRGPGPRSPHLLLTLRPCRPGYPGRPGTPSLPCQEGKKEGQLRWGRWGRSNSEAPSPSHYAPSRRRVRKGRGRQGGPSAPWSLRIRLPHGTLGPPTHPAERSQRVVRGAGPASPDPPSPPPHPRGRTYPVAFWPHVSLDAREAFFALQEEKKGAGGQHSARGEGTGGTPKQPRQDPRTPTCHLRDRIAQQKEKEMLGEGASNRPPHSTQTPPPRCPL